ncbi:uncharacterized protein [Porites lutea]|uniref:uncharacterized protein n=1 Tax=Porites lutea TaxID=51062 RepID=UPI003CC6A640
MATSAPSPLASSVEKTNGAKLSRLLIDGGTTVLRKIFDGHHPPANLITDLNANYPILNNLLRRRVLNGHQWDKLFPPGGVPPDSNTFDITLLFLLLTKICGLTPPPSGWHTKPPSSDTSHEANLARVKFYRNILYGHVTTTGVDTSTFSSLWTEISGVLVSLGLDQAEVDRLKAEKGGEQDYIDVLIEWAVREEDIKSQLENYRQAQAKIQQSVEELGLSLKGVKVGVEEINENLDWLKGEKDKNKSEEVLQKLAKSEFRGDIEYHLQRFQDGTREWVFDRVQNWLNDRSSQNRVMVISGNAGMGKSVIAAVICKRMQQAGRLSGSHFCQYNNVRYCKPQLMIQSLACHLSHALPEYKRALGEQLSRNLGTDLNNMGVEELFALLFKEPLSAVGDPGRNMLMVIDGLDESEYQGRSELLNVIANQFCKLPIWIRFLVTTRPALNIAERLKHLKPLELQSDGEDNLEDVRVFCLKRLERVVKPANVGELVERLVLKSEGLMLYAHFLILSTTESASISHERDLVGSSPLGIFAVYHSYFKRLGRELINEHNIREEHFLNLLSSITASREPLPVGFVSKVFVSSSNSPLTKRKVHSALGSVSALLPIRDDCLHVIHKSVKDWLTDISCHGEHEFIMDENEGHRLLADLCIEELENLKLKGVDNLQFGATERYALYHGAHHMLHEGVKREPHKLDELTKAYIIDLEVVYAKTFVNSTIAAEDLLWLNEQGIFTLLSKDNQSIVDALLFVLRKNIRLLTDNPRTFLQTILNQGGKVLTVEASNLLRNKYPEIPYMEVVHKETQQGGVLARFECLSDVICLDVSPQLDYMVCECDDGILQLWSLQTGRLVWTRPVLVEKSFKRSWLGHKSRKLPSINALSFFRSVVFHPTKECILPGILSQAYTMDGNLKPLFLGSNCRFSVCSISGDKAKILTNCLESSKGLVMWSLENGSEVDRILVNEDILSFAWSGDGRFLVISHSSGVISLYDVMCNFRKLTQMATPEVWGMVKFSPDHRFIFGYAVKNDVINKYSFFCLEVVKEANNTFSLTIVSGDSEAFESFNDCGFLFGDLISTKGHKFGLTFGLDKQRLLRSSLKAIEMVDTKYVNRNDQGVDTEASGIALSLDGQTVFVARVASSVTAYDVSSGKLKAEINYWPLPYRPLCPVSGGVLILTNKSTVELWSGNLAGPIKRWINLPGVKQLIPISEERVAVVGDVDVKVLDTSSGIVVSTIPVLQGRVLTCNNKCQLLSDTTFEGSGPWSLQLLDGETVVWRKKDIGRFSVSHNFNKAVAFSTMEQFLVVGTTDGLLVLDAETGNTLRTLGLSFSLFLHCTFISDDTCVIYARDLTVQMFNVKSGELLTGIDVESEAICLAACPFNRVLAIGLRNSTPNFKVIRVHLSRGEGDGNMESGHSGTTLYKEERLDPPEQNNQQANGIEGEQRSENEQEASRNSQVEKKSCCMLV